MKKLALIAVAFLFGLGIAQPPAAEARVAVVAGFGCCYGGGGYYGGGYPYAPYPAYYYPYTVAPPPVVYAVPPPSPIVYAAPPAYAAAPAAAPVAGAPQAAPNPSAPYIDGQGRTCRQIQPASAGQPYSTACLQPDGTWRAVQ